MDGARNLPQSPMTGPATSAPPDAPRGPAARTALPVAAVVLGAIAMGLSPIFVRLADVGPFASAFWRTGLALPILWAWAAAEERNRRLAGGDRSSQGFFRPDVAILMAGVLFAGDLFFWHLAILNTSVANATLLATMAPVWVVLGSSLLIGEHVDRGVISGLLLCILGAAALVGTNFSLAPDRLIGDAYGVATSFFFGMYFLAVRAARRTSGSGRIVFISSLISAVILLTITLIFEGRLLPQSASGLAALAALALISHAAGQGLLAYALGHLPAAFSSLIIFIEAVAAAAFAWLLLGEPVVALQIVGGATILAGVFIARPGRPKAGLGRS